MTAPATPPTTRAHYAWVVAGVTFLTLLAAAGTVRDSLGDYRPAFLFSGALCAVAAVLALRVRGLHGRGEPRAVAEPVTAGA